MELFKITCVTCRAGLSVRNESIIGQIIACPQCGSMVQVVAPGGPEAPAAESDSPAPAETPIAPADWQSAAGVATYKWIAWTAAVLVVGTALAAALLVWPSKPQVSDAASPRPTEQPEPIETVGPAPGAVESTTTDVFPIEPTETEPTSVAGPAELPAQTEVIAEQTVEEFPVQEAKPHAEETPVDVPRIARRFDPLDLDPEGLDLAVLDRATEKNRAPIESSAADEGGTVSEVETSTLPLIRRGSDSGGDVAEREAEVQLARQLPALEVRSMRLVDFLSLVSQLSGCPVSVGAEQLLLAGISPREKVTLAARDIRLDEALSRVLDPLRLEYVVEGPQVIVVRQDADRVREIDYPIDDLVSSDTEAQQLAEWVRQLVAMKSWTGATLEIDGDSLRINQSQRVHYQILVFLERLRLLRGLSTRSRYPVERLAPTPLQAAMAERLAGPAQFTFSQETPLAEVFQHWQRELDLPLLVDWPSLAEVQLWPESTVICAVADRPWQEVLSEVLESMDLQWRVTFGGAINISSAEQIQSGPQLELYPLVSLEATDSNQVLDSLRYRLSQTQHVVTTELRTAIVFDPTTPAIFALQPAQAQREILTWLQEQGLFRQ